MDGLICQQCGPSLSWHSQYSDEGALISLALDTQDSELAAGG